MDKLRARKQRLVYPQHNASDVEAPHANNIAMTQQYDDVRSISEGVRSDVIQSDPSNTPDQVTCHNSNGDEGHVYRLHSKRNQGTIGRRLENIARRFSDRALRVRRRFDFPPTPSTTSSDREESKIIIRSPFKRIRFVSQEWGSRFSMCESIRHKVKNFVFVIEPQSYFYIFWLCLTMVSYLYNCWVIPLLIFFPYRNATNEQTWFYMDSFADVVYLLDLMLIKPRIMYLEDGFWVRNINTLRHKYIGSNTFKMDVLSLLPLDYICRLFGVIHPILRLPRMCKIQASSVFFDYFDHALANPYAVRVTKSLTYMMYLVHLNACAYYFVSVSEGIGTNSWVYNGEGNAYIRCFYFGIKTATSIGKNPKPENDMEYVFMTTCWLMGVFVFALLIGQIRDIIATATKSQTEYRKYVDEVMEHLRKANISRELSDKVKMWFTFTWEQHHTLDELQILDHLPVTMKIDIAIDVYRNTLNKVQLFKDCDDALVRDLILKLRSLVYLPGDYICRKGVVGKEMYIVKNGQVQVVDGDEVLATLTEGTVFGEISLLSLDGVRRRTADVRSNGFSTLLVLSKEDLDKVLVYYPTAKKILKRRARQLMRENAARECLQQNSTEGANNKPNVEVARVTSKFNKVHHPRLKNRPHPPLGYCTNQYSEEVYDQIVSCRSASVDLGDLQGFEDYLDSEPDITTEFPCHVTVHQNE